MTTLIPAGSTWVGGPNYYPDICGEYVRGNGWTYDLNLIDRVLSPSLSFSHYGGWTVRAELRIQERHGRASSWSLSISISGGLRRSTGGHKCRSIRQAKKEASAWLVEFDVAQFLRDNFAENSPFWSHLYRKGEHLVSVSDLYLAPGIGEYDMLSGGHSRRFERWFGGYTTSGLLGPVPQRPLEASP